jgi:nuclear pore complex protein Nup205
MADDDSLRALEGLHRDFVALADPDLSNLERLLQNLENHLDDFKALIDKKSKNDTSRQALNSGT